MYKVDLFRKREACARKFQTSVVTAGHWSLTHTHEATIKDVPCSNAMRMNGKQRKQGDTRRGSMWASLLYHHENTASSKSLGNPPQPEAQAAIKLEKYFPPRQSRYVKC